MAKRLFSIFFLFMCVFFSITISTLSAETISSPSIVFLNPGEPEDRGKGLFWPLTAQLMTVAAESFQMDLEVLYAERDHLLMLRQADELSKRAELPDYIIMVNEKQTASQMMSLFKGKPTKILLIHNDLTPEQRREFGNEREGFSNWIGSATTDEESGTARMMEELYKVLGSREPQVIGITGDRGTPVAQRRAQGVRDFISQSGRGRQLQLSYSNWSAADSESKARVLLARYPQANIIWAANFSMALGALKAVEALNAPVLVGSIAAPPQSLSNLTEEGMAVCMGSHFFIGAWSMVLIYDYHNGLDFAEQGGARQRLDYLSVVNSENGESYYRIVYDEPEKNDFTVFSQHLYPTNGGYNFSLKPLMSQ